MYKIGEDVFINSRDFRTVFNIAAEWDDSWERDYIFTYIKSDIDALNTIETEYGIIIYLVS